MRQGAALFSVDDIRARAAARLRGAPSPDDASSANGDHALNPGLALNPGFATGDGPRRKLAAVLAPIVARPGGATVLLTQRSSKLRDHSGQIAFPGGRIDAGETPLAAALREAEEEIGLDRRFVSPLGYLDAYQTGTGYLVHPVIALVEPGFELTLNPDEVEDTFEAPLEFLMNQANHERVDRVIDGVDRHFYAMPWNGRFIWGATAGMLRDLCLRMWA